MVTFKSRKSIIALSIVGVALLTLSLALLNSRYVVRIAEIPIVPTTEKPKTIDIDDLPPTVFDGRHTLPNTDITFVYPRAGFYGHGVRLRGDEGGRSSVYLKPMDEYDEAIGCTYYEMNVHLGANVNHYDDSYALARHIQEEIGYTQVGLLNFNDRIFVDYMVGEDHAYRTLTTVIPEGLLTVELGHSIRCWGDDYWIDMNNEEEYVFEILRGLRI